MQLLADEVGQSCEALARLDLVPIEASTARQQELCTELRAISLELPSDVEPDSLKEFEQMRARLAHLNGVQGAVLRGARRSVQILANVLAAATTHAAAQGG